MALGLARFASALLLPAMRTSLDWCYAQAGAMNTGERGRLLVWCGRRCATRCTVRQTALFCAGVFGTAIALVGCGAVTSFLTLLLLRVGAGFFGALSFVLGASLAMEAASSSSSDRQAFFISIYFAGLLVSTIALMVAAPYRVRGRLP